MAKTKHGRAGGYGSLEKRGRGFIGRWTYQGKRYAKTITGEDGKPVTDRRTAEKILDGLTAPFRLEGAAEVARHFQTKVEGVKAELEEYRASLPTISLADGFDAFLACEGRSQKSSQRTLDGYKSYYDQLVAWLAANRPDIKELREVTAADAKQWATDFLARYSAGTFGKHLTFLRSLWKVLAAADEDAPEGATLSGITVFPFDKIQKREHVPFRRRELTVDELRRICSEATGELRLLLAIGLYCGLRLGDAARLRWESIDFARSLVTVVPRKTARSSHGRPVAIPLHEELARLLMATDGARSGYVLPGLAEMHERNPDGIAWRLNKLFHSCGIETTERDPQTGRARVLVGFHSLRHSFVSLCANAGVPLTAVQGIVGHASSAMTTYYAHPDEAVMKSALAALPNISESTQDAPSPSPRLDRLRALLLEMDAQELAQAAEIVRNAQKTGRMVE